MNQTDFAKQLGMSYRNYQEKIQGDQPNWKLSELIKLTEIEKDVDVEFEEQLYRVNIRKL